MDIQFSGTKDGTRILINSPAAGKSDLGIVEEMVAQVRAEYIHHEGLQEASQDKKRDEELLRAERLKARALEAKPVAAMALWKSSIKIMQQHMHRFNLTLEEAYERAADAAVLSGDWEFAVTCFSEICALREAALPPLHPRVAIGHVRLGSAHRQAARIASVDHSQKHLLQARTHFQAACATFETLYGPDAPANPYVSGVRQQFLEVNDIVHVPEQHGTDGSNTRSQVLENDVALDPHVCHADMGSMFDKTCKSTDRPPQKPDGVDVDDHESTPSSIVVHLDVLD